jgi:hypothetical protein
MKPGAWQGAQETRLISRYKGTRQVLVSLQYPAIGQLFVIPLTLAY